MAMTLIALAIACCGALALAGGKGGLRRPGEGAAADFAAAVEGHCNRLNHVLRNGAVILAVLVAVLSTGTGSKWGALIAAHQQWLTPASGIETGVGFAESNTDGAAAECRTWIYTCRCMRGRPYAKAAPTAPDCAADGE